MILSLGEQLMTASTLAYVLVSISAWMLWNLPFMHQLAILGIPYTLLLPQLDTCDSPVQFMSLICLCFHFFTWDRRVALRPVGFLGAVEDIMRIWLLISIPVAIIAVYKICSRLGLAWSLIAPYIRPHLSLVRRIEDILRQYMTSRCPQPTGASDKCSPPLTPTLTPEPEPAPLLSREAIFKAIEYRRKMRARPVIIIRQTGGAGIRPDGPGVSIPRSRGTQTDNVYQDSGVQTDSAASTTEEPATPHRMHGESPPQRPRAQMVSCSTQTGPEDLSIQEPTIPREPEGEWLSSEPEIIQPDAFTALGGPEASCGLEGEGSYMTTPAEKYEPTTLVASKGSRELDAEELQPHAEAGETEPTSAPEELETSYEPEERLQFESAIDGAESVVVPEEPKSSCELQGEVLQFESAVDEVEPTAVPEESGSFHKLDGEGWLIEQAPDSPEPVSENGNPKDSRELEGGGYLFSFERLPVYECESGALPGPYEQEREGLQVESAAEEHFERAYKVQLPTSETQSVHDPIPEVSQVVDSLDALPPLPAQDDIELASLEMGSQVANKKRRLHGVSVPSPSTDELPRRAKHGADSPPGPEVPSKRRRYEVIMDDRDVQMAEFAEFPVINDAADENVAMSITEEDTGERMADVEYEEDIVADIENEIEMSFDVSDPQQLPEDADTGMSGTYYEANIDHVDFDTENWAYPSFLSVDNQNSSMFHQELGTHTEQQEQQDIDYYMSDVSVLPELYHSTSHGQHQGYHATMCSMGQGQQIGVANTHIGHWAIDVSEPMFQSTTLPQSIDALPMSDESYTDTPKIWQEQSIPVSGYVTPSHFLLSSPVQEAVGLAAPESSDSAAQTVPLLDVSQLDSALLAGNESLFSVTEERAFTQGDVDAVLALVKDNQATVNVDPAVSSQSEPAAVVGVPSQSVESLLSPIEESSDDEFDERSTVGRTLEEILEDDDPWLFEDDPPDSPSSDAVGSPSAQSPRSGLFDSGHVPDKNRPKKHWLNGDSSSQLSDSSSRAASPTYRNRPTKAVRLSSASDTAAIDARILEERLALGQDNLSAPESRAVEDVPAAATTEPQAFDPTAAAEPTTVFQESQSATVEELELSEEERDIVRLMDEELAPSRLPAPPTTAVALGRPTNMTPSPAQASSLTESAVKRLYDITPVKPNSNLARFDSFTEAGFDFQSTEAQETTQLAAKQYDWACNADEDRRAAWADHFVAEHDRNISDNISTPAEIARRQILAPKARFGLKKRRAQVPKPGNVEPAADEKVPSAAMGGLQTKVPDIHHSPTASPPQSTAGSGNEQLSLESEAKLAASVILSPEEDIYSDDRVTRSQKGSGGGASETEKPSPVLRGGLWMSRGTNVDAPQTPVLNSQEREAAEDNISARSPTTPGTGGSDRTSKQAGVRKQNASIFMATRRPLNHVSSPAARCSHANAGSSLRIIPAQMGQDIIRRQEEARKAAEKAREGDDK